MLPRRGKARFDKPVWDKKVTPSMVRDLQSTTGMSQSSLDDLLKNFNNAAKSNATNNNANSTKEPAADGRLNREQFDEMWKKSVPGAEAFGPMVFNTIDTDGDGYVNFQDFVYGVKMAADETVLDKMTWALKLYEATGSTTVNYSKVTALARDAIRLSQGRVPDHAELEENVKTVMSYVGPFLGFESTGNLQIDELIPAIEAAAKMYAAAKGSPGTPQL